MDLFAAAKMIKDTANCCKEIKEKVEKMIAGAKGIKTEIENFKGCLEQLKKDIECGDVMKNAKKAKDAGKKDPKTAYECVYGEIKAMKSVESGDSSGCTCTTF